MLDLFTIPVVEPYAISEPFSTAGKINMNHLLAPFSYANGEGGNNPNSVNKRSYIRRDTALRGVLKSVKMMVVPTNEQQAGHMEEATNSTTKMHYDINADLTLGAMEQRMRASDGGLFRAASEICDVDLHPNGITVGDWGRFWDVDYALSGDDMRERPYAHIYPKLTTRSNVFNVHMRCQAIKKAPNTPPGEFIEGRDQIVGEYRGSSIIERFVDPNDPKLRDYDADRESIDDYYRFRVVSTKQFAPR
jgi:uncharacterized protein (TIGR02600 family)